VAVDEARSEAVILLLGRGISPYPKRDPERLTQRFGEELGLDLVQYSEAVLAELYAEPPDWSTDDLKSATENAVQRIRSGHPELSDEALSALGWSFSWDWK
jgi:hypothetical protein